MSSLNDTNLDEAFLISKEKRVLQKILLFIQIFDT